MRSDDMTAVPATDASGPERLTGVSCPTCPGVLRVAGGGRDALLFQCRIGHVFSMAELLAAKEQRTEDLLWAAVEALEELSAILRDVRRDEARAQRATAEATCVRQLIDRTRPAALDELSGLVATDQEKCPW